MVLTVGDRHFFGALLLLCWSKQQAMQTDSETWFSWQFSPLPLAGG